MKVLHADHPLTLTAIFAVDRVLEIKLVQLLVDTTGSYKIEYSYSKSQVLQV